MNLVAILLLIVAYLLSMILLFFVYRKARRWSGVLPCAALSVAEFLALVGLVGVRNGDCALPWAAGWSAAGAAAFLICTALALVLYRRRYRRMLSGNSIQESTDKVPLGLCFYYPDGVPILINARMQHLAERVTGSAITNAEVFCRRVDRGGRAVLPFLQCGYGLQWRDRAAAVGNGYYGFASIGAGTGRRECSP